MTSRVKTIWLTLIPSRLQRQVFQNKGKQCGW